jgi:regulator of protease activity HflC (stomatin/prohibitin superfamily)
MQTEVERIICAQVLESEGKKQAQILELEGKKTVEILESEGDDFITLFIF